MVLENCITVVSSHECDPPVYYSVEYTMYYSVVQLYCSSFSAHRVCVLWNSSELKCYQIYIYIYQQLSYTIALLVTQQVLRVSSVISKFAGKFPDGQGRLRIPVSLAKRFLKQHFGSSTEALSGNEITVCDHTGCMYIHEMMGGVSPSTTLAPPIISRM